MSEYEGGRKLFIIKCSKCGNEVQFKNDDSRTNKNITIIPDVIGSYSGYEIYGVDIYCENIECNNNVYLK